MSAAFLTFKITEKCFLHKYSSLLDFYLVESPFAAIKARQTFCFYLFYLTIHCIGLVFALNGKDAPTH